MDTITLKVYTPEGVVLDEKARTVTLQTADGEVGILPGHARYISLLGTGILSYVNERGEKASIVASEGFCHFADGTLTVLADVVEYASSAQGRNLEVEKHSLMKELTEADFFNPVWDLKRAQLKRIQALEDLTNLRH